MPSDRFADFSRFKVRNDLVVHFCADRAFLRVFADVGAHVFPYTGGVLQNFRSFFLQGDDEAALLAKSPRFLEEADKPFAVQHSRKILRVVDGVDPDAVGQQKPSERWQGGVEFFQEDF